MAEGPGVDVFGGLRAHGEVEADGLGVDSCAGAGGGGKEEEHGGGLEHHLWVWSVTGGRACILPAMANWGKVGCIGRYRTF